MSMWDEDNHSTLMLNCANFESVCVTIQTKVTEENFPMVLFILLYKVVQSFESVGEILI